MFEYIKTLYNRYKTIIILGLVCILLLFTTCASIRSCISYKNIGENNIVALTDSIHYYKTKNNELYVSKTLLQGNFNTLKLANDSLYNVIKKMKIKNPTTVVYVDNTIDNGQKDTTWIINDPIVKNDSIIVYPNLLKEFKFINQFRELTGNVFLRDSILGLNIDNDKIFFDYTLAVENNKVFIKSNNPYIKYNEIQGLTLPNTKRQVCTLVVGPSINYGYNFGTKKFDPSVGISITYGLDVLRIFKK